MSDLYKEKFTINGKNIIFLRDRKPVENRSVSGEQEDLKLLMYDVTDPSLVPSNYDKPDGAPMTLMEGEGIEWTFPRGPSRRCHSGIEAPTLMN